MAAVRKFLPPAKFIRGNSTGLTCRFPVSSSSAAALGAPALLAGLAYLNARWRVTVDTELIFSLLASQKALAKREAADRINSFYLIEDHAQNPKVADQIFLIYQGKKWTFKETYTVSVTNSATK